MDKVAITKIEIPLPSYVDIQSYSSDGTAKVYMTFKSKDQAFEVINKIRGEIRNAQAD